MTPELTEQYASHFAQLLPPGGAEETVIAAGALWQFLAQSNLSQVSLRSAVSAVKELGFREATQLSLGRSQSQLKEICEMVAPVPDRGISEQQFSIAMHLTYAVVRSQSPPPAPFLSL